MEETKSAPIAKPISLESHFSRTILFAAVIALVLGTATGYMLSKKSPKSASNAAATTASENAQANNSQACKDFAEGTIRIRKDGSDYSEGSHILERDKAYPVALTSSTVDLSKYEGKKVKVCGETQKALSEGWLMDVGKVEEIK
jgi:hypothetical protein